MGAEAPRVVIPLSWAPKKAPCPHCGRLGRRKRMLTREVRTLAHKTIAIVKISYGEYAARCHCCATFRTNPDGVLPKAKYDNKVRQAVLHRIIDDGLNPAAPGLHSLERDFLLNLSSGFVYASGFVYDCLRDAEHQLCPGAPGSCSTSTTWCFARCGVCAASWPRCSNTCPSCGRCVSSSMPSMKCSLRTQAPTERGVAGTRCGGAQNTKRSPSWRRFWSC